MYGEDGAESSVNSAGYGEIGDEEEEGTEKHGCRVMAPGRRRRSVPE